MSLRPGLLAPIPIARDRENGKIRILASGLENPPCEALAWPSWPSLGFLIFEHIPGAFGFAGRIGLDNAERQFCISQTAKRRKADLRSAGALRRFAVQGYHDSPRGSTGSPVRGKPRSIARSGPNLAIVDTHGPPVYHGVVVGMVPTATCPE